MCYLLKLTVLGIMLKADNRFQDEVELCRPQVRATVTDIAECVGDMVGQV